MTAQSEKKNCLVVKPGAVPPAVYLMHISDTQWEDFIEHACRQRPINNSNYVQVKRLGNANDKGRDVEARLQKTLVENGWDLFQAKHYKNRLTPGDAFLELAKFFIHLNLKSYPCPRKYYLCAPQNTGPELHDLLANPSRLKQDLLTAWTNQKYNLNQKQLTSEIKTLIEDFDFSKFEECLVCDLISWHALDRKTHFQLFGIQPERGDDPSVPTTTGSNEMVYVNELIKACIEHNGADLTLQEVINSGTYGEYFNSARSAFYSAEGLRRFSRDIYEIDEFSKLMRMVKQGTMSIISSPLLKTGIERHDAAMQAANTLPVTDSVLSSKLRGADLQGTCHHLVNEGQLKWVR